MKFDLLHNINIVCIPNPGTVSLQLHIIIHKKPHTCVELLTKLTD